MILKFVKSQGRPDRNSMKNWRSPQFFPRIPVKLQNSTQKLRSCHLIHLFSKKFSSLSQKVASAAESWERGLEIALQLTSSLFIGYWNRFVKIMSEEKFIVINSISTTCFINAGFFLRLFFMHFKHKTYTKLFCFEFSICFCRERKNVFIVLTELLLLPLAFPYLTSATLSKTVIN